MAEDNKNNESINQNLNSDKQVVYDQERVTALSQMLASMPEDQRNQLMMNLMQGKMPGMSTPQLSEKDKLRQKLKNKIQQQGFSRMGKKQQTQIKQKYTDVLQKKMETPKPEEKNNNEHSHENCNDEHCHEHSHQ